MELSNPGWGEVREKLSPALPEKFSLRRIPAGVDVAVQRPGNDLLIQRFVP